MFPDMPALRLVLPLLLTWPASTVAQSGKSLSDHNHLVAPLETEIQFRWEEALSLPKSLKIVQYHLLDFTTTIDTILDAGTSTLSLTLSMEAPRLIQCHLDSLVQHIFVVPGHPSIIYLRGTDGTRLHHENVAHEMIRQYYGQKFEQLGVHLDERQGFQFLKDYPDLNRATAILDSMTHMQLTLLSTHAPLLPDWFLTYEEKHITYTSLIYKLSSAYNLVSKGIKSRDDADIVRILQAVNPDDELGILIPLYLHTLTMASMIKYCQADCYQEDFESVTRKHSAILQGIQEIEKESIRQALVYQKLLLNRFATRPLPDRLVRSFQQYLTDPRYQQRLLERSTPQLEGRQAPGFYLKNLAGTFQSAQDFQGQVTLLNFWFVGCRPCQKEIPHARQLVESLAESDFSLINVCMTSSEEAWRQYVKKNEMPGEHLLANDNWTRKIARAYGITVYPRYILLDAAGKVVNAHSPRPSDATLISEISRYLEPGR